MEEKKMTFEEGMARLGQVVERLKQGDTPLEEAMALFEEGTGLLRRCNQYLNQAEQKVSQLFPAEDGTPARAPMVDRPVEGKK